MNNTITRRVDSFRRVQGWHTAHPAIVQAAPPQVLAQFTTLDGVVITIENLGTQQAALDSTAKANTTDASAQRAEVFAQMHAVAQVAKGLKGVVLGISALDAMPNRHARSADLIVAGNAMVTNATPFKQQLVDQGLAPSVLDSLQAAVSALQAKISARGQAKNAHVTATKGIDAAIKQGMKTISFIEASLMPQLRKDPALLASWRNAKRLMVKGVPGSVNPAAVPAAAPTGAAPQTSAAPVAPAAVAAKPVTAA